MISHRLYIRVALAIALIAVIVSLLASALSYYFGLATRQQATYLFAEQLAKTVEKTAANAAFANDAELAQKIVNGLATNPSINSATLTDNTGLKVSSGSTTDSSERIATSLRHPVIEGMQVGMLDIYLDEDFVQQQTLETIQKEIFILLSLSLIMAFFVSLLVHRRLTKPIQRLIDNFGLIDPHSPITMRMLPYKGQDEISKLVIGINSLMHELHHSLKVERDLRVQTQALESKFRLIYEQASAGICLVDDNDKITTCNPAFAAYFNAQDCEHVRTQHFPTLLTNPDRLQQLLREIRNKAKVEQVALDVECEVAGKQKWMHCLFAKVTDQRATQRDTPSTIIEVILYDVTERAERELQTRFEADHDLLTHLLNRRSGEKKLHKMLYFSIKNQQPFVLMMVDLDKFKPINDTYGHDAGDKVLREVSRRIRQEFSADSDVCIRWGGDEFVIAYEVQQINLEETQKRAEKLLAIIQLAVQIQPDVKCSVGASIGLVFAPEHGKVLHELLVNADNSMYLAKEQGRGSIAFHAPSL